MTKVLANQGTISEAPRNNEQGAAPFDRAHIARYTLGDLTLEAEIITIFQGELGKLFNAIRLAADDHDWGFATHSLKGAARAVGAWQIAEIAEQLEKSGKKKGQGVEMIAQLEAAIVDASNWSPPERSA